MDFTGLLRQVNRSPSLPPQNKQTNKNTKDGGKRHFAVWLKEVIKLKSGRRS